MKSAIFLIAFTLLVASVSLFCQVFAQQAQISYSVNLNSVTLQVSCPSEVIPGDSVTVNVQVMPRSNIYLQSLTATIYFADATGLHQLASQTLVTNLASGYGTGSYSKSFEVNVPQNAPRTSLIAIFSESVQSNNYYYYGPSIGYSYYSSPFYYYSFNSYSFSSTSDDAIAPLSYIKAATPESASLQSKYQLVQQQLNQTQSQNQQLQSNISQLSATISELNQRLSSTTQTYQMVAVGLGILSIALAALNVYQWRKTEKSIKE
jgi:hypothetical protein